MAQIQVNGLAHYYETAGEGEALVLVHGAFADTRTWDAQWEHFRRKFRLVRYDLRGHGRTGVSQMQRYTMETFVDDLRCLLEALGLEKANIVGQSWGGSIAMGLAALHPGRVGRLVTAGSMVSIRLTLLDRLLCDVLFPRWAMLLATRVMSIRTFTRFSMGLGRLVLGKDFLSKDKAAQAYLQACMLAMDRDEYTKIWGAMYGFDPFPLERIRCPVLVLNGELESRNTRRHSAELMRRALQARAGVIAGARHGMNMENPPAFNRVVEAFLLENGNMNRKGEMP